MTTKKIKVLLVDDHSIVRNGIRMMIDTVDDIDVTGEAASATEALSIMQQKSFDIALLDIELPDSSGLDLLKILRKKYPKLIILMLSIYSEEIYATRALKYGASGYMSKDCSIETLVTAIRKAAGSISKPYIGNFFIGRMAAFASSYTAFNFSSEIQFQF
ncbi:MAG: response regulator transcription factor [bacterium]